MVHFGCHGNVNFEQNVCIALVLSIVKSDMDILNLYQLLILSFATGILIPL